MADIGRPSRVFKDECKMLVREMIYCLFVRSETYLV